MRGLGFPTLDHWVESKYVSKAENTLLLSRGMCVPHTGSKNLQMHKFSATGFSVICTNLCLAVSKSKNHGMVSFWLVEKTGDVFMNGTVGLCSVESGPEGGQIGA